jgi:hypothetical protein
LLCISHFADPEIHGRKANDGTSHLPERDIVASVVKSVTPLKRKMPQPAADQFHGPG